ncbi:CHC2 zinc finger domain-containing protein [Flexivirga alba]|uniref:CHC2 zinc finger domain-containing protein n=1 Tax=Flexivirga alba TaxID=702742 RepID=A0ABW2AJM4_9MICO
MVDTLARTDIEDVRARHRIEDVVAASGVELRQVGRQLMGHCPFHDDHTASLSVGGVAGRYHCFGCGAGGDVIDYVGRLHGVGFRDAIALLDGQQPPATMTRPLNPAPDTRPTCDIGVERAWEINAMAWTFYTRPVHHEFALAHTRHRRGLDLAPAEASLGYPLLGRAGNNWTALARHLRDHGVTDAELTGLDLGVPGRHGLVDTYRERLVVPVTDNHGHITGLVGRDLSGRPRAPKYRNPTRTVVFDKSAMLYTPARPSRTAGRW